MTHLYAESSAVLSWLLEEPMSAAIRACMAGASRVVTSALTVVECERTVHRAFTARLMDAAVRDAARRKLEEAIALWSVMSISKQILRRAREPFPSEPVRSLDALHLASALRIREGRGEVSILSLDKRVRANATGLGFVVVPTLS